MTVSSMTFDESYYLTQNPDVLTAVLNGTFSSARQHFDLVGFKELRDPNANFDVSYYLTNNTDVLNAGVNAFDHFLTNGVRENRAPTEALAAAGAGGFDETTYLAGNTDVQAAVTAGTFVSGYQHWILIGQYESRPSAQTTGGTDLVSLGASNTQNAGSTFTLTTSVDSLTGTANNDTFIGVQTGGTDETWSAADTLDGAAGTDTFTLTNTEAAAVNGGTLTNIQNLSYRSTGAGGTLDLGGFTSVTNLTLDRFTVTSNVNGVALTDTLLVKEYAVAGKSTITYGGTLTGTDSATVSLNGNVDGSELTFAGAVETMTLTTTGAASRLDLLAFDAGTTALVINAGEALTIDDTFTAAGVTKLTVSGDSLVTITPALNAATISVDSSAQTAGGLVFTAGNIGESATTAIDLTVVGGAGADTVILTGTDAADEVSVSTGAGNDTVTIGGLAMDGSVDVLNGGDGTDTLAMNDQAALTSTTVKSISNFEVLSLTDDNDGALDTFDISLLSGITSLAIAADSAADGYTVSNLNATQAAAVTVSGTQAVDLTLSIKDATTNGQLDTLSITFDDGAAATSTITLADLSSAGTETVNLTATDNLTLSAMTGLTDFTKVDVGGAGNVSLTTGALAIVANASIDASDVTGTVIVDASSATTNGLSILGSSTKANTITGTNLNDAIVGGTAVDTVTSQADAATDADTIDFVSDSSADIFVIASVIGKNTITNFDAATDGTAEDLVNVSNDTVDGGEVVVTAAAAQGAITDDRTYIIEQTIGTAAALTTAGTATLATADYTAATLTNVAAYLSERFTTTNDTNTQAVFVLNNGTDSYAYAHSSTANGTTIDAAELALVGVFSGAILQNEDVFQTV